MTTSSCRDEGCRHVKLQRRRRTKTCQVAEMKKDEDTEINQAKRKRRLSPYETDEEVTYVARGLK